MLCVLCLCSEIHQHMQQWPVDFPGHRVVVLARWEREHLHTNPGFHVLLQMAMRQLTLSPKGV